MRVIVQASWRQSSPIPPSCEALGAAWVFSGIFFHERGWWVGGWVGWGGEARTDEGREAQLKKKKKKKLPPRFLVRSRGRCIFGSTNFECRFFCSYW